MDARVPGTRYADLGTGIASQPVYYVDRETKETKLFLQKKRQLDRRSGGQSERKTDGRQQMAGKLISEFLFNFDFRHFFPPLG
jgi:hypothetical protein